MFKRKSHKSLRLKHLAIAAICSQLILSGCASVVAVGAASTAASSASDRRTVGTQIDDKTMEARVSSAIDTIPNIDDNSAISIHVYNGQVLLTGQANQAFLIDEAERKATSIMNVKRVHNQIRLGSPIPASSTMHDIWLGTKIRTLMGTNERVPLLKLDLIVEDSEVFIMGKLTRKEALAAVDVARNVKGVTKVVRVLELTD
ncbi:BON domain-containing protein [Agaribacter marinus]|uniref:Osmotically-inducible protein OsmY n=1 Tax=Agaribacter marinus TaxID=1431249 RepID=A0AA37T2H2_9ALTE|nr:BON domain-containing protein [Agaribacter marinus]GLR72749.1 osmotically-inducible protein OsmY [Agaribacter marinus]